MEAEAGASSGTGLWSAILRCFFGALRKGKKADSVTQVDAADDKIKG